jgi:DNA-binding NtrC family response regulator
VALTEHDNIRNFAFAPAARHNPVSAAVPDGGSISVPIGTRVDEATKRLVQATLQRCAGNKLKAARMLGIPPRTMYRRFSDSGE